MKTFGLLFWLFTGTVLLSASPWQGFTALSISHDGRTLATGGWGGEVITWDSTSGEMLARWTVGDGKPVAGLLFSPSGPLGVALADGRGYLIDSSDHSQVDLPLGGPWKDLAPAALHWQKAGPPMSGVTLENGRIQGFPSGQLSVGSVRWQGHSSAVTGLAMSPDGRVLYSSSFDGSLACWDGATGELLARL